MKKRCIILLLILFLMPIVFAYTQEDEIIGTEINISVYGLNYSESWINLTVKTEDDDYTFWNITNLTSPQILEISFLRDITCDECPEESITDIANLTQSLLEICTETTSQCDNVYSANTQCSIDLLSCRNAYNETTDYKEKYNTCNTALATCNAETCETDWGGILIAGVIGIVIGIMIQKSKGVSKRDIDNIQTSLKETDDLSKKGIDWEKLKKKAKDKMDGALG